MPTSVIWLKLLHRRKWPLRLFLPCMLALWLVKVAKNETLRVEACPGSTAPLPCPALTPIQDNDRSLAAFWYKDDQVTPFYMVDGRTNEAIDQGKHRHLSALGERSFFNVTESPAVLYLEVDSKGDAGVYVCRVDSYRSLTRTSTVELYVKAPTPKLLIYEGGTVLSDVAGPYTEGSDLELTCELTGVETGPVQVLWRIKGRIVDSTFKVQPNGRIRNDYLLRSLHRSLWMEPLACLAAKNMNATGEPTLSASVQLDLFLRPLGVRITPSHGTCREGSMLELHCRTWGSRPPADISWWMKSFRLSNVSGYRHEMDGSSRSALSLFPLSSDHGQVVTCRAENPMLPGIAMTDTVILNVTFPPKVILSLKTYSSSALSEGDTVALICNVVSNPPVGPVHWTFVQETSVVPETKTFPMDGPQTLVLERLLPWHKGSYRCKTNNSEGTGESNALWLAVRHRPICRAGQKVSYGAYFGETLNIRCEVEAEPGTVTFHWGFSNTILQHGNVTFVSRGLRSVASYTPTHDVHLGSLFCWANNTAGEQHVPCTFTVFKPEPPNRPKNCQASNRTQTSFLVSCEPGYDGGAAQRFHFRASIKGSSDSGGLKLVSPHPAFTVSGLPAGTTFEVKVFSRNKMGHSGEVVIETTTARGKRKGATSWKANRSLLISSLLVLCFAILTLAIAAVLRHRSHPFLL